MEIKQAIKTPYNPFGKSLGLIILFLIGSIIFVAGVLIKGVGTFLGLPQQPLFIAQIVLMLVGSLIHIFYLGYIGRVARQARAGEFSLPDKSFFSSLFLGLQIFLILLIFYALYQFTLFIQGILGVIVSFLVLAIIIISLPAIYVNMGITGSLIEAFRWDHIIKTISKKEYWIAYGVSLLVLIIYSLINTLLIFLLQFILRLPIPKIVGYLLGGLGMVIYLFFLLLIFLTWATLFGQVGVEEGAKPAGAKQTSPKVEEKKEAKQTSPKAAEAKPAEAKQTSPKPVEAKPAIPKKT